MDELVGFIVKAVMLGRLFGGDFHDSAVPDVTAQFMIGESKANAAEAKLNRERRRFDSNQIARSQTPKPDSVRLAVLDSSESRNACIIMPSFSRQGLQQTAQTSTLCRTPP